MPGPSTLNYTDDGFVAVLQAHEQQITNMIDAGNRAESIKEEIAAGYIAGSSTQFQARVDDWVVAYKNIMTRFDNLMTSLGQARSVLTEAEQDAHSAGGNWAPSDGVYQALSA